MICSRLNVMRGRASGSEDFELDGRQLEDVPANACRMVRGIQDQLAMAQWCGFVRLARRTGIGAFEDDADTGDKLARAERLGDIVVAADFKTEHPVDLIIACGQEQDRLFRGLSDLPADFQAVLFRQADVEDDQVGRLLVEAARASLPSLARGRCISALSSAKQMTSRM